MQTERFIFGKEALVEDVQEGLKRQILGYNDDIMLVKAMFDTGAEGYQHAHIHSQVAYVASGVFDVTIDGVTKRQSAGDCFFIPPNVMHGAICIEEGVLLDMFSPIREDFFENYKKGNFKIGETS